jgi:hypothetical protein
MLNGYETVTLVLFMAFLFPLGMAWLINKHPNLVAKGQDAAGRGMAVGCTSIVLMIVSGALAIAAAVLVAIGHQRMAIGWNIVGVLPITGSFVAAFVIYTATIRARDRRARRDKAWADSVPGALIVDDDDARFSTMFDAIKPKFRTLEISMRHPGALYWQQGEWFPRLRLLMLGAEAMLKSEGQNGELTQDLFKDMCRRPGEFPILLHSLTSDASEQVASRLIAAGWKVHAIIARDHGESWIESGWLAAAVPLLKAEMERRPERPPPEEEA